MKSLGKGCLVTFVLIVVLPLALGAALYFAGPRLLQREVKTPELTPLEISQAETKIDLPPAATTKDSVVLEVTDLNALVQQGLQGDQSIKNSRITIKDGNLAVEASLMLPSNSQDFPLLLRGFAGKEVGVYLELTPSVYNDEVYVSVGKASIGVVPLPVKTLMSLLPWMDSVAYTERGININELIGPDFIITDIKIANDDVEVSYKTR